MAYASLALSNKTATPFHTIRKRLKEAESKDRSSRACKLQAKKKGKKPSKACLAKRKAALSKLRSAKSLHAHFKKKGGKSYAKKAAAAAALIKTTEKKLKVATPKITAAKAAKLKGRAVGVSSRPRPTAVSVSTASGQRYAQRGAAEFDAGMEFEPADMEDFEMASEAEMLDMPLDEDFEDFGDEEEDEAEGEGIPTWMIAAGVLGAGGLIWFLSGR